MNEAAISVIQKYIDECLIAPGCGCPEDYLAVCSYSRWAAYEIQERFIKEASRLPSHITGREPISPVDIILDFISEMDWFTDLRKGTPQERTFSIARDVAEDILYLSDWSLDERLIVEGRKNR